MKRTMYQEEVYERSQLARASRYRKGKGGRATHTRLPSDNMTKKEWEAKNGPVITFNPNQSMSWEDFKKLDDRLKKEYLTKLINKHGGNARCIAAMFGVHEQTIRNYGRTLSVRFTGKNTNAEKKQWEKFLKKSKKAEAQQEKADEAQQTPAGTEPVADQPVTQAAVQEAVTDNGFVLTPPAENPQPQPMDAEIASLLEDMTAKLSDAPADEAPTDPVPETPADTVCEIPGTIYPVASVVIPSGTVTLQGSASACLEKIAQLLGEGKSYAITVQWTIQD